MKLTDKINRIEQRILALARARVPNADVFSIGAINLSPAYLAIWITTETDTECDALAGDRAFCQSLKDALIAEAYPPGAVDDVGFAFQSEETVRRDYDGNWWYAIK